MGFRLTQLSANSLPRGAHSGHKYIQIVDGFTFCLQAGKFAWRNGVFGPTICGLCCVNSANDEIESYRFQFHAHHWLCFTQV